MQISAFGGSIHLYPITYYNLDIRHLKPATKSGMTNKLATKLRMLTPKVIPITLLDNRGSLALILFLMLDDRFALKTVRFFRISLTTISTSSSVRVGRETPFLQLQVQSGLDESPPPVFGV